MADQRPPDRGQLIGSDFLSVTSRRTRRLLLVLVINAVVVGGQAVGGIAGHSVGLLADAGHNLTDVAAAALSLIAVRLTRRAPTESKSFGYHRSTVLAAQANAAAIVVVTVLIAVAAIDRLLHPTHVHGAVELGVALGAAAANALAAVALIEHGRRDLNMRATLLHMGGDAIAAGGVAAAGLAILIDQSLRWLDPTVSLGIALLIAVEAIRLGREVTGVLLEATPGDLDAGELAERMAGVKGVDAVHDLHIWSLSSEVRALSAHLVLSGHPTLEEAQTVGERVKQEIRDPFGIAHATLELECEACAVGDTDPCTMEDLAGRRSVTPGEDPASRLGQARGPGAAAADAGASPQRGSRAL